MKISIEIYPESIDPEKREQVKGALLILFDHAANYWDRDCEEEEQSALAEDNTETPPAAKEEKPKKRKRRTKAEIEADKAAEAEKDETPAEVQVAPEDGPTLEVVKTAVREAVARLKAAGTNNATQAAMDALVESSGAKNITSIPEDKYGDVVDAMSLL